MCSCAAGTRMPDLPLMQGAAAASGQAQLFSLYTFNCGFWSPTLFFWARNDNEKIACASSQQDSDIGWEERARVKREGQGQARGKTRDKGQEP